MMASVIASAIIATNKLRTRVGPRPLVVTGMLLGAGGMLYLTQLGVASSYATGILPALIMLGIGLGLVFSVAEGVRSVAEGVRDGVMLLRQRSLGVIAGSVGTMAFDLAVLGVCFRAFGGSSPIGVLVLGYLIGQLGGNLPLPGGLGGIEGGLVGTFALYHQPVVQASAAVLVYHAISLWVPALLGSAAFLKQRKTLAREQHPTVICAPAPAPIRPRAQPVPARGDGALHRGPAGTRSSFPFLADVRSPAQSA